MQTRPECELNGNDTTKTVTMQPKYDDGRAKEYYCDITSMLDKESSLTKDIQSRLYRHYVLADDWSMANRQLAIRVPGRTYGGITIDDHMVIRDIVMDNPEGLSGKRPYPRELLEKLRQFIGYQLRFE